MIRQGSVSVAASTHFARMNINSPPNKKQKHTHDSSRRSLAKAKSVPVEMGWSCALGPWSHAKASSMLYFGFVGGFGFGTPVVSYAPRPMLSDVSPLVIMESFERLGW